MKVCITEKPSVARDIARILGADTRRDGYFEGNGYQVTWTFGHLCCLKDPHDYAPVWKKWTLGTLPMIPQRFGIKLIPQPSIERQFKVIETLAATAESIINCGDAGQEGELIQRWVMQKAKVTCPVMRLWISSLTDESIRQGLVSLQPQENYTNLYFAGLSRAVGDWVLGINATRLYTLKYSLQPGNVLSVGRVQTPTLALIVQRQREIDQFKPEPFWELKTVYRGVTFNATSGRFTDLEKAKAALEKTRLALLFIKDISKKSGKEAPPRLFDLTSLQVECNKRWGWSADQTLRLIQSLYEKKVTTYPRVDTTFLPDDIYPKVPGILKKMSPYANLTAPILANKITKSKKVFDNAKVTDHHAIIPTGEDPRVLVGDERILYHLIARRFISVFYPDCKFDTTTVLADIDGIGFKTTGKIITDPGWKTVYADDKKSVAQKDTEETAENDSESVLPNFTVGESGPHKPDLVQKSTQPPKPYTEGTLLRAMETAGKNVDDDTLRDAMKENGIGRPSTRSAIIETLFKRNYIIRERKNIRPTEAGTALIDTINIELLKSPKLTGLWENKLRRIERGQYSAHEFIAELKTMVNDIVIQVLNDNSGKRIDAHQQKNSAQTKTTKKTTKKTNSKT